MKLSSAQALTSFIVSTASCVQDPDQYDVWGKNSSQLILTENRSGKSKSSMDDLLDLLAFHQCYSELCVHGIRSSLHWSLFRLNDLNFSAWLYSIETEIKENVRQAAKKVVFCLQPSNNHLK